MFPGYRHAPIFDTGRKRCPVCNQSVYSLAGIHPQCAIKLAEGPPIKGKKQSASKVRFPRRSGRSWDGHRNGSHQRVYLTCGRNLPVRSM